FSLWDHPCSRPGGETGRRKGLKIPRWRHHVGSIPTPGTRGIAAFAAPTSRNAKGRRGLVRYSAYIAALVLTAVATGMVATGHREWTWVLVVAAALAALGTWDLLQRKSTLRRNYPLLAYFRYGLESIGPEIRQYFIESDTEEA